MVSVFRLLIYETAVSEIDIVSNINKIFSTPSYKKNNIRSLQLIAGNPKMKKAIS